MTKIKVFEGKVWVHAISKRAAKDMIHDMDEEEHAEGNVSIQWKDFKEVEGYKVD